MHVQNWMPGYVASVEETGFTAGTRVTDGEQTATVSKYTPWLWVRRCVDLRVDGAARDATFNIDRWHTV